MDVASVLLSSRNAVSDPTIQLTNELVVAEAFVTVHLYQPLFQGCIVANVTEDPIVPTTPDAKSKFTKSLLSPKICAKLLVPFRKNTDKVLTGRIAKLYTLTDKSVAEFRNTPNKILAVVPTVQGGLKNTCVKE